MVKVVLGIFAAGAMWAQTAAPAAQASPAAPPEVDAALRARITQFYQLEVEGKFRQAEQLVAEDTKDLYVGSSKPLYSSFEILSIAYAEDFTKARVIALVTRQLPVEGFLGHPVKTKAPSRWKVENGLWCYYVDPRTDLPRTPFAPGMPMAMPGGAAVPRVTVPVAPGSVPAAAPTAPPAPPPLPQGAQAAAGDSPGTGRSAPPSLTVAPSVPTLLKADKPGVQLKASGPSSDVVTISNPTPFGTLLVLTDPKVPGLTVTLDNTTLRPFERASLKIQWSGAAQVPAKPVAVAVRAQRTKQVIPITVSFKD